MERGSMIVTKGMTDRVRNILVIRTAQGCRTVVEAL